MTAPLISVIIPCYNQAQYLDECLQSVLDQTYPNWECIIVNDGSPDNTEDIALQWTDKDDRFLYLNKENGGLSSARNAGLENAKGDWIQFLDCDDTLEKEKFQESTKYFENHDLIISQFNIQKGKAKFPGYSIIKNEFLNFESILLFWGKEISIPIHCGLFKSNCLQDFKFDTNVKSMEDWLMWLHFFNKKPNYKTIDNALANYRKEDDNSMSGDLKKLVLQKIAIFPKIKILYGDETHDRLAYHEIKTKSFENLDLKIELKKLQNDIFLSKYLNLKKLYYNLRTKI